MGIKGFEHRLEQAVEGTFARLFRTSLSPVELGRKLVREMDQQRRVGVDGRSLMPNHFDFLLSAKDHDSLGDVDVSLRRELAEAAREHGRDEGCSFVGPVTVAIATSDTVNDGVPQVTSRYAEAPHGPGSLVLPTGDRVELGEYTVTIGRDTAADIVLGDPNASRRHAEVMPVANGFAVVDLGALNGTKVNGHRITQMYVLADGDELQFGNTTMRFEAS
ncbi:MAG: FhaA domain-containing protein [Actinomycetes bacterium]